MIKTYNDCKEFPLYNFERVETTGDFRYIIKNYDAGDEPECDLSELEEKYKEIVQDYVISLNSKNFDITQYGKINAAKVELMKFAALRDIIALQLRSSELGGKDRMEDIKAILSGFKMQKTAELKDQIPIIDRKIEKLQNDIAEAVKKLEKKAPEKAEESDINSTITNVELILERGINMREVSLYRFGIMQEQARKKIEAMSRENRR